VDCPPALDFVVVECLVIEEYFMQQLLQEVGGYYMSVPSKIWKFWN